jgi:hypothetical protein
MSRARLRPALRLAAPGLVVVTIAVLARAEAPPDQYDAFNRADTVITDAKTLLGWQRTVTTLTDFPGAVAACNGLSLGTLAAGWRLPSYKELLTLVDEYPHTEYPTGGPQLIAIDGHAFPETPVTPTPFYWTSSVVPGGGSAFAVEFVRGNGHVQSMSSMLYVRCVHDP